VFMIDDARVFCVVFKLGELCVLLYNLEEVSCLDVNEGGMEVEVIRGRSSRSIGDSAKWFSELKSFGVLN
jgi:hypothetical protein